MASDAVLTSVINAVRDTLVAGVIPAITYVLTRRRARKNRKELGEQLDTIKESNASALHTCSSTITALANQVERLQAKKVNDDARNRAGA